MFLLVPSNKRMPLQYYAHKERCPPVTVLLRMLEHLGAANTAPPAQCLGPPPN